MSPHTSRRQFLGLAAASASVGLAGCSLPESGGPTEAKPPADLPGHVGVETVVDDLGSPVDVVFDPAADRRYVATQEGLLHVHDDDGLRSDPLLDLREEVVFFNEQGLLGVTLHPNFPTNRRLFVRYSSPSRAGTPENYSHTAVLSEFRVSEDGTEASMDAEQSILEIPQPHRVHNGGDVRFGPDGYLYLTLGDGGQRGDYGRGHVDDWYDRNRGGNAQDVTENLLGSILRIDVDRSETIRGTERPYGIPADNPLVGAEGLDEQFAWGFRNPWRASFDGETYYVGDVGQNLMEEIDVVEAGGNYGWNVREGTECFDAGNMNDPYSRCPDAVPSHVRPDEPLVDPIIAYPNERPTAGTVNGLAVVGGHVYRGSALPGLEGRYVFGDFQANGRLFVGIPPEGSADGTWQTAIVEVTGIPVDQLGPIRSFGRDDEGELYVLGGSGLHRLRSAE